jgi:uncharacterized protein
VPTCLIECIDGNTRRSVDMFLARIKDSYPVSAAYLYGSRARGDHRADSDADLAVIVEGPKRGTVDVAVEMANFEADVLVETGILVSAMPIWIEDWDDPAGHANPWLVANIKREGLPL